MAMSYHAESDRLGEHLLDRVGQIEDPFGHGWSVHTHIVDISADEMMRRVQE
jgi:hypothetical protein